MAVASAAAFAGIAGGLAAHGTASSSPAPTTTPSAATAPSPEAGGGSTTTTSPTDPAGPDGTSWSGTPAPSGSLTQPQGPTHARSRAS